MLIISLLIISLKICAFLHAYPRCTSANYSLGQVGNIASIKHQRLASLIGLQTQRNLTNFQKKAILEMNRLGTLLDLSHLPPVAMATAIQTSRAPVILSFSRNVNDAVLRLLAHNGGVVMVNFHVKHINYIVDVSGVDHVGLVKGSKSSSNVSFATLKRTNETRWNKRNLEKLALGNLYRVAKTVEEVRYKLKDTSDKSSIILDVVDCGSAAITYNAFVLFVALVTI